VGFFVVIITLLVCTDNKNTAEYVFTHFENNVGWKSDGVAWSVGTLTSIFAFFSLDAACHYSEEVENAQVVVPRASKFNSERR
jgi:choline transport protein